jgi:hypothetical protein
MCTTNDYWRFVRILMVNGKCIVGSNKILKIKLNQGGK